MELDTPEKNRDKNDVVKLGGKIIHTDQHDWETSKGRHSKQVHGEEDDRRASKGNHPGTSKGSDSKKMKGKKRKRTNDSDDEGQDEPKLTSKQVLEKVFISRKTFPYKSTTILFYERSLFTSCWTHWRIQQRV